MPRSIDSGTVNVRPQRPSCRTTSSGWIEQERKKQSNAFEAAGIRRSQMSRRSLSDIIIDQPGPLTHSLFPFQFPDVFLTILLVMKEGEGLARQLFRNCLSTLLTYFLLRKETSLL